MVNNSKSKKIRTYYLGSGAIGIPVLESLLSCPKINVVGCATQPDRPKGRKRVLTPTPIGQRCQDLELKPEKPESVNTPRFLKLIRSLDLDLLIVFSFGQILCESLLILPRHGCLNIHTSLLPKYRGASPISAAILAGDQVSGISFMNMDPGLDTGPVYRQFKVEISNGVNAQQLEKRMANTASDRVCDIITDIVTNGISPRVQENSNISYAKKVGKNDGKILWQNEASYIERQVRAYYPWPGAWFILNSQQGNSRKITITSAEVVYECSTEKISPGTVIRADNHGWEIACGKDVLRILKVIPEGKREMSSADYLRGKPKRVGSII